MFKILEKENNTAFFFNHVVHTPFMNSQDFTATVSQRKTCCPLQHISNLIDAYNKPSQEIPKGK